MKEYIEREKAVGIAHGYCHTTDGRCCGPDDVVELYEELKSIPAADVVEVRHGRWVNNDDGYGCEDLWWCSACKEEFVLIEGTPHDNGYHYCPNCGAKMDGGVNDAAD